jgi:hypothetical protein
LRAKLVIMAKPRKQPAEKRDYKLNLRLNADERKQLELSAKMAGLRAYSYARLRILGGRIPKPVLIDIYRDLYQELKKIGVNINQLARVANSGKFPAGINNSLYNLSEQINLITKLLLDDRHSENR